ncbi:MAG: lipid-A-disaccharide synthase N-terminal domain-containing protein [Phycisphaerales bacterium]|nr:lipid-A-disaccharide synthase N-terminal domain-containing protein [Phycisphaerales bacterium]
MPLAAFTVEWFLEQLRDPWVLFGFGAQFLFFARFAVQWLVSERRGKVHVPVAFWYLSLAGGLLTFVYATRRQDIVFMVSQALGIAIYLRNLWLIYRHRTRLRTRASRGLGGVRPPADPPPAARATRVPVGSVAERSSAR